LSLYYHIKNTRVT